MPPKRMRLTAGWAVANDAKGNLYIVDAAGIRPLEHPDPVQRLFAFHLAAASPNMRNALEDLAHRMDYLMPVEPYTRRADERLIQQAYGAIICSRPQWQFVEELLIAEKEKHKRAA